MSIAIEPSTRVESGTRLRHFVSDSTVAVWRNLLQISRVPTVMIFELLQPIMFVLLFSWVFARNIANLPGDITYVEFLMPGIFVQNAIFGATTTAVGLAEDLKKGIIDRFRSLPMARSAVLVGRTVADVGKNFVLVLLVIVVGYLVGFRFENGLPGAVGTVLLVLAIGFAFSWISATVALTLKEVEAVQAAMFTGVFPIVFVSSAFVPVAGMANWLQPIAEHNPVTIWANTARVLSIGDPVMPAGASLPSMIAQSTAWIAGLLLVFVPLAIRQYRKLT
ncbi:MAG TPA: ABC transporter permease [Actinomycetota bacterium]|nr:ABC transporter permease [Actinomycetota bacterium]